jgi:hypothetical protein
MHDLRCLKIPSHNSPEIPQVLLRRARWSAFGILGFLISVSSLGQSSVSPGGALRTDRTDEATPINQPPDANFQLKERNSKIRQHEIDAINALRIRQVRDDSAKLLILARDVKLRMEAAGSNSLTSELVQEIGVMEKLAHDVQTRMTTVVVGVR